MTEPFVEAQTAIRLFDARLDHFRRILAEFPEEKLWIRPKPDMVSLGNLACHLAGSMRDWFENGAAQGNWNRQRQYEFDRQGDLNRQQLLSHLDQTRQHCDQWLSSIDAQQWNQTVRFRDQDFSWCEILLRQVEHVAYHVGQAAFLRRIVADLPPAS